MKRKLFNDNWTFIDNDGTFFDKLVRLDCGKTPKPVTLPHDAMIHAERKDSVDGVTVGFYEHNNYSYWKTFFVNKEDKGKVVWLEFEGIYHDAYVMVNDALAGRCIYGFGNYYIEITDFVLFGKENVIQIIVKNYEHSARWYTGGGMYRDVNIMFGEKLHIACEGSKITATDIEDALAILCVETPLEYIGSELIQCMVEQVILDQKGDVVVTNRIPATLLRHENYTVRQRITLRKPHLWNLDTPYLYTCRTTVSVEGKIIDDSESRFGVRKIQVDVEHGLRINGKYVRICGGCIHQDLGIIGAATFKQGEYRRIKKVKEAGFNAIRTGAHPASKAMLDACDEMGILVLDEFTDVFNNSKISSDYGSDFEESWRKDLENMVKRDYNHPSVFMYDLGCENHQISDRVEKRLIKQMCDVIRNIDEQRLTTMDWNMTMMAMKHPEERTVLIKKIISKLGIDINDQAAVETAVNMWYMYIPQLTLEPMWAEMAAESCDQLSVVGYNYMIDRYPIDHELYPDRLMLSTEGTLREMPRSWEFSKNGNLFYLGEFMWCTWDYLGEVGIGRIGYDENMAPGFYAKWPYRLADIGVIDLIGTRRPQSYWIETLWEKRSIPYIAVRHPSHFGKSPTVITNWSWISDSKESWTWPGYENKPVEVEVYSVTDEVELFVNGKSVGKKKTGDPFTAIAVFQTVYEAGEIKAVDTKGNEFVIRTAKNDSIINTEVENEVIKAGEQEIAFITISMCDADGVVYCPSEKKVHVEVTGSGELIGLGTGNPIPVEEYDGSEFTPYYGHLLAIVRSGKETGEITVDIDAEGCSRKTVKIAVI